MSHNKERAEKICLNCGASLEGRYCHACGQENVEPKETVWGLVSHFAYDITHFDGKFFSTVKYLLIKPGFLSAEYIRGRRMSYLHPIRMYVFTASFFFIIFFSLFSTSWLMRGVPNKEEEYKQLIDASKSLGEQLPSTKDTVTIDAIKRSMANIDHRAAALKKEIDDEHVRDSLDAENSKKEAKVLVDSLGKAIPAVAEKMKKKKWNVNSPGIDTLKLSDNANFTMDKNDFRSIIAYDSLQKELPDNKRDGWVKSLVVHKMITMSDKWKSDKREAVSLMLEKFMHTLPQVLFVSLPLFALILLMLYARRKFYYVDHGIFTIHLYCATFILLLVYFGIDRLETYTNWKLLSIPKILIIVGIFIYLYKAMRKFYRQGRFKTIIKFLLLNFFSFIVFVILASLFFLLSLAQVS